MVKKTTYPDLSYEKKYWAKYSLVIAVDEVGRGAFAGPLYTAAVCFPPNTNLVKGVNDSKKLTPEIRKALSIEIKKNSLS